MSDNPFSVITTRQTVSLMPLLKRSVLSSAALSSPDVNVDAGGSIGDEGLRTWSQTLISQQSITKAIRVILDIPAALGDIMIANVANDATKEMPFYFLGYVELSEDMTLDTEPNRTCSMTWYAPGATANHFCSCTISTTHAAWPDSLITSLMNCAVGKPWDTTVLGSVPRRQYFASVSTLSSYSGPNATSNPAIAQGGGQLGFDFNCAWNASNGTAPTVLPAGFRVDLVIQDFGLWWATYADGGGGGVNYSQNANLMAAARALTESSGIGDGLQMMATDIGTSVDLCTGAIESLSLDFVEKQFDKRR